MEAGVAPQTAQAQPETISVTVELSAGTYAALEELSRERGITIGQALSQAITDEKWLRDRVAEGGTILLRRSNGELVTVNLP